jgi:hypothetical protein
MAVNKALKRTPAIMREMATDTILKWQSPRTTCMFHILQEVCAQLKVSVEDRLMLGYLKPHPQGITLRKL